MKHKSGAERGIAYIFVSYDERRSYTGTLFSAITEIRYIFNGANKDYEFPVAVARVSPFCTRISVAEGEEACVVTCRLKVHLANLYRYMGETGLR